MLFCVESTFDVEETLINNYERETTGEDESCPGLLLKGCGLSQISH
jgi:hypothetical protein